MSILAKWLRAVPPLMLGYVLPATVAVTLREQPPLVIVAAMFVSIFLSALLLGLLLGFRVSTSHSREAADRAFLALDAEIDAEFRSEEDER